MRRVALSVAVCMVVVSLSGLSAQQADSLLPATNPPAAYQAVPRWIMFSGTLKDVVGKPLTGPVELHFSIYKEQADAAPLWQETQTLQLDEQGHYIVLLGGMQPEGLPIELFTTGEARWLGVAAANLPEQPRTLLVSVPYALKANDAEMLGGRPASAYMLAPPSEGATYGGAASSGGAQAGAPAGPASQNLKPGKSGASPKPYATPIATNYIPVFTNNSGALGSSVIYQSGSNIGVGTQTPQQTLDVNGKTRVGYTGAAGLTLTGSLQSSLLLTDAAGGPGFQLGRSLYSDNGQNFFVFDRAASATRLFIDSSGNVGLGTANPQATLHVNGKALVSYTGFAGLTLTGSQQSSMVLTNAAGAGGFNLGRSLGSDNSQNFYIYDRTAGATRLFIDSSGNVGAGTTTPGAKLDVNGTANVSGSVTANAFSGDGTSLSNVNAAKLGGLLPAAYQLAGAYAVTTAPNSFAGAQTISSGDVAISNGNLALPATSGGSAGVITLGGMPFLYAYGNNTFVGTKAGNFSTTGSYNTASGGNALHSNTTGVDNTASGYNALLSNTTGDSNTASGTAALFSNTTGYSNAAGGTVALYYNTTGSNNTGSGYAALGANTTGSGNTATGYFSLQRNCHGIASNCAGNYNTGLGYYAGVTGTSANANVTGAYNTFLGAYSGSGVDGTATPISNATAIGAHAVVSESNALVLGSISGVNAATSSVNVGIGTPTPAHALDVVGDINASGTIYGNGSGLTNVTSSSLSCSGCVGNTQLSVNYAASASQGGDAVNSLLLNGLASSAFQPAGSYATLGANTFASTQTINNGNLSLPATSGGSAGVITLGGTRFLHGYGGNNTFVGPNAGNFTTTGSGNIASGGNALNSNTTGVDNTADGYNSLVNNTTGYYNTASGFWALVFNTTVYGNTASGYDALGLNCYNISTGCTGNYDTAIGYYAGLTGTNANANVTGAYNTFLGANSGPGTATQLNYATAIGYGALVSASNSLVRGGTGTYAVNVGVGVTAPIDKLQVYGDIRVGTSGTNACVKRYDGTAIAGSCSSDVRLKTHIQPFAPTLQKLTRLTPVHFDWKVDEFPEMHFGRTPSYGLIAQEVEKVFPEMVGRDEHGFKTVDYTRLPLLLLEALRELKAENDGLREQVRGQNAQIGALTRQVHEMERVQRRMATLETRLAQLEGTDEKVQAAADDEPASRKRAVSSALAKARY